MQRCRNSPQCMLSCCNCRRRTGRLTGHRTAVVQQQSSNTRIRFSPSQTLVVGPPRTQTRPDERVHGAKFPPLIAFGVNGFVVGLGARQRVSISVRVYEDHIDAGVLSRRISVPIIDESKRPGPALCTFADLPDRRHISTRRRQKQSSRNALRPART
jgi:hypothetical protein